jgi:hypothetical protein
MKNPVDRRLDRVETEVQKRTDPGRGPVFKLIDDSHDPENGKRLQKAAQFMRDNPNGQIIHIAIVHPPNGEPNWERYIASGTNVRIAKAQAFPEIITGPLLAASPRPPPSKR